MADKGSLQDIKQRIQPILDNVAVEGLRAWLKTIGLSVPRLTRAGVTEHIVKRVADGELTESALESALIGFEEASDMRIYLLQMDRDEAKAAGKSLSTRLQRYGIPVKQERIFAGHKTRPMSPVYAHLEGNLLRLKWAEEQTMVKVNAEGTGIEEKKVEKRAVLIANFGDGKAELRLNPPDNRHSYQDESGRMTADAYYDAYLQKARDILGCKAEFVELRPVIKRLVEQEEPRLVRIHIDDHTSQKNYKTKTIGPRADVRDSDDWQLAYKRHGETWAWDAESFYWLPKASSGFLEREVYTHINADEGYVKVNADCSNEEVEYVISRIRAR
ncbi:MAG: hypothetical protein ABSD98_07665 [Candidatus Korobacteraceae bacterium]|jgi:hypothetical protein